MKFFTAANALALGFLLLSGTTRADPPPDPSCKVFCFRITDIRSDPIPDRFHFEFEILNWADTPAGGLELGLSKSSSLNVTFAPDMFFNFDGIDADGRPLQLEDTNGDGVINATDMEDTIIVNGLLDVGEDKNGNGRLDNDPIPGNLNRNNDWSLTNQTDTKMEWELGTPLPFINLLDAISSAGGCGPCITSLSNLGRAAAFQVPPLGPVTMDAFGNISPVEAIDNGDNVQDGFVMTLDGLAPGKTAHINWFLKGAGDATVVPENVPGMPSVCRESGAPVDVGAPIGVAGQGNAYGFGLISLHRVGDDGILPPPCFEGQAGMSFSTRDFFDSVYNVPAGPGDATKFAMEFGAGLTAPFRNPSDNSAPTNAIKRSNTGPRCGGDPHFRTWGGERFSFHGECDLVLVRNPDFAGGLGIHIHGRTKIHDDWSSFHGAAVQIGSDVLEVEVEKHSEPQYWVNGVAGATLPAVVGGYEVALESLELDKSLFVIYLDKGVEIHVKTFGWMTSVEIVGASMEDFNGSDGLLGSYGSGQKVARDGKTIVTDANVFGLEWQVRDTDPQLFHSMDGPQYPQQCKMPEAPTSDVKRRRLGEYDAAKKACAHVGDLLQDDCIFDVLATGNVDVVGAYD